MKKSNIKSHSFVIINNELCESDKNYIRKRQGYATSKIYDSPYKQCHQNFAIRIKKEWLNLNNFLRNFINFIEL
jgi:hypothetical protein